MSFFSFDPCMFSRLLCIYLLLSLVTAPLTPGMKSKSREEVSEEKRPSSPATRSSPRSPTIRSPTARASPSRTKHATISSPVIQSTSSSTSESLPMDESKVMESPSPKRGRKRKSEDSSEGKTVAESSTKKKKKKSPLTVMEGDETRLHSLRSSTQVATKATINWAATH